MSTLHEDLNTRMIISRCILFRMRNVPEFVYTIMHFLFNNLIFRKSCSIWDNVENMLQPDRLQITIRRMRFACWITKATDVQLENILFIAFPRKNGYENAHEC